MPTHCCINNHECYVGRRKERTLPLDALFLTAYYLIQGSIAPNSSIEEELESLPEGVRVENFVEASFQVLADYLVSLPIVALCI